MGKAMRKLPASERDIYAALSERFRAGDIYSFSYEGEMWSTWTTEADYNATERNGKVRDQAAAAAGHGPIDRDSATMRVLLGLDAPKARKLSKPQLVAKLRAMQDRLPREAVELLGAA